MCSIILVYKYDRLINLLLILTNDDTNNINFSEFTFYEWTEKSVCLFICLYRSPFIGIYHCTISQCMLMAKMLIANTCILILIPIYTNFVWLELNSFIHASITGRLEHVVYLQIQRWSKIAASLIHFIEDYPYYMHCENCITGERDKMRSLCIHYDEMPHINGFDANGFVVNCMP